MGSLCKEHGRHKLIMTSETRTLNGITERKPRPWVYAATSFSILVSLGFPGLYTKVFGGALGTLTGYGAFFLQLFIMLVYSAGRVTEIKLISLQKKYMPIYFFLITIFIVSMIGTSDAGEEVISCVRVCVTAIFALWLCDHMTTEEILTCTYNAMILYVAAAVVFAVMFPGYYNRPDGQELAFMGIEDTKNVTAMIMSFGIIMQYLLWRVRSGRNQSVSGFFVLFFAVEILLLVLCDSTSATMTALLVILLVIFTGDRIRVNTGLICVVLSILFLIFAMTVLPVLAPLLNAIGEDATLTGRTPLWAHLLDVIRENHTLVGYGYGHFWLDAEAVALVHTGFSGQSFMSHMTAGAHNNILELWLNTGLIGLLSFFTMLIASFSNPRKITRDRYMFCLAFMAFYTLVGLTERNWSTYGYKMIYLFLAAGMACTKTEISGNE